MEASERLSRLQAALTLLESGQAGQRRVRMRRTARPRRRGHRGVAAAWLGDRCAGRGCGGGGNPEPRRARAKHLRASVPRPGADADRAGQGGTCRAAIPRLSGADAGRSAIALWPGRITARAWRRRGGGPAAAPVLLAHPDNAEAHYEMGQALAEAGRFAEAADSFRKAIACDPEPAAFWANLGMMLKVEGQFGRGIEGLR